MILFIEHDSFKPAKQNMPWFNSLPQVRFKPVEYDDLLVRFCLSLHERHVEFVYCGKYYPGVRMIFGTFGIDKTFFHKDWSVCTHHVTRTPCEWLKSNKVNSGYAILSANKPDCTECQDAWAPYTLADGVPFTSYEFILNRLGMSNANSCNSRHGNNT